MEGNIIEPFRIGRNAVVLSHLQFVDDTILFCREESFLILGHIASFFEDMPWLIINRDKCTIFGINSDQDKLKRWTEMFDC